MYGHISPRFVTTRNCLECNRIRVRFFLPEEQLEKRKEAQSRWVSENKDRVRENHRNWSKANKKKVLANTVLQQQKRAKRVVPWSEIKEIEEFYENCPDGYEVDHIIPLQGKTVSGLHVIRNLQYLLAFDNKSKGNKA